MKKYMPLILVLVGVLLMGAAAYYAWQSTQPAAPVAASPHAATGGTTSTGPVADAGGVPQTLTGLPLTQLQKGADAMAAVTKQYGVDVPLVSGLVATYGQSASTLWVAETESNAKALELMTAIKARIDQGGSSLTPVGVFNFRSRNVYMLTGSDGLSHFYMQSGKLVFWVAIGQDLAEQAMKETLDFYP